MSAPAFTARYAVVYRKENIDQLTAAAIIAHQCAGATTHNVRSLDALSRDWKCGSTTTSTSSSSSTPPVHVIVFGSYYTHAELLAFQRAHADIVARITVHMYLADMVARGEALFSPNPSSTSTTTTTPSYIRYDNVDSARRSYAAFVWAFYGDRADSTPPPPAPRALRLVDLHCRAADAASCETTTIVCDDADDVAHADALVEWLQTRDCTLETLAEALFDPAFPLDERVNEGVVFGVKSASLVRSICSTAGWYVDASRGARVAVVDAARQIQRIGEHLCVTDGAQYAVVTRFDHAAQCTRFTVVSSECNAVEWARQLGYDAGGDARTAGFTSTDSVAQFVEHMRAPSAREVDDIMLGYKAAAFDLAFILERAKYVSDGEIETSDA
jgi:hypothetical protein